MKALLLAATILAVSAPAAFAQCHGSCESIVLAEAETIPAPQDPAAAAAAQQASDTQSAGQQAIDASAEATAADATEPAAGDQIDQQPIIARDNDAEIVDDGFND